MHSNWIKYIKRIKYLISNKSISDKKNIIENLDSPFEKKHPNIIYNREVNILESKRNGK